MFQKIWHVLRCLRVSRRLFRWIAGVLLVGWLLSLFVVIVDGESEPDKGITDFPDTQRAVALGVRSANTFSGMQTAARAFVNICPSRDGWWTFTFSWSLNWPTANLRSKILPELSLVVPSDLKDVNPEKRIEVSLDTGQVIPTGRPITDVKIRNLDLESSLITLRATEAVPYYNGHLVFYGVNFKSRRLDVDRSLFGRHSFKVSYYPELARRHGLIPGLGGARPRPDDPTNDFAIIFCDESKRSGIEYIPERFNPLPALELPAGKLLWKKSSTNFLVIHGVYSRGRLDGVRSVADWFSVNAFAALLGAIYGEGIAPKGEASEVKASTVPAKQAPPAKKSAAPVKRKGSRRSRRRRRR